MGGYGFLDDSQYLKFITEARKCFDRQDREKACHWYYQAGLHERDDAALKDLGDFLVVATEHRPDLAGNIAKLILNREELLPPLYMQDVLCCALFLPDRDLEQQLTKRALDSKPGPNLCVRMADIYFEYATDRRHHIKASRWLIRAAEAEAITFSDWAAKAYALYLAIEDDEKAQNAMLECAKRAAELADTDEIIDIDALEDLIEALDFLEYEGSLIAKFLYEKLLVNDNIALPEKHRIWQDLKELQNYLDC